MATTEVHEPECTCDGYRSVMADIVHDGDCPRYEPNILSDAEVEEIKADEWTNASTIKDLVCTLEVERNMHRLNAGALVIVLRLAAETPAVLSWTDAERTAGTGQCIHCDNGVEWDQEEGWLTGLHAEHCVWRQAVELSERVW